MLKVRDRKGVEWLIPTNSEKEIGKLLDQLLECTDISILEGKIGGIEKVSHPSLGEIENWKNIIKENLLKEMGTDYTNEEKNNILNKAMKKWQDVLILIFYVPTEEFLTDNHGIKDWKTALEL